MKRLHALAERIRRGEPVPRPLAALLTVLTPITRLGMARRMKQPVRTVNARVISFGNLTVGGTGKTPAVIERAAAELAAGRRVAVLTRGYGGRNRDPLFMADATMPTATAAWLLGDEPALILKRVPGVILVKAGDRVAGAQAVIARFGCDTLILDDGFQYLRLGRDENVVVIDATNPFGNERLIPRGILREDVGALTRATRILLTHCDKVDTGPLEARLASLAPTAPVRRTRHAPTHLWRVVDGARVSLDAIKGQSIAAACAIGNPDAFFSTLESLGARVEARHAFRDHATFNPARLTLRNQPLVVTEKDAVRMTNPPPEVLALAIALEDL